MNRLSRLVIGSCLIASSSLFAGSFSFTGNFSQDDNIRYFTFNLASPATVTILTLAYGGGINAASLTIPQGGFDPLVALFAGLLTPTGDLQSLNNDGGCGNVGQDSVTNACWDSFISVPLGIGNYTVALLQSDNGPLGSTLGDGFLRTGEGNFTGPAFVGSPGSFWDANPNQRTSAFALDIINVNSAADVSIPEPGSLLLMAGGLLLAGLQAGFRRKVGRS